MKSGFPVAINSAVRSPKIMERNVIVFAEIPALIKKFVKYIENNRGKYSVQSL